MPWPKNHKSRTRASIVQAAAAAFRAGGIAGVRIEDIMAHAGLTHGGFYAHFDSKDDLLREALKQASGETVDMLSEPLGALHEGDRLRAVIDAYLSPAHAAHAERGCPLAALGPEVARAGGTTQRNLAASVQGRLEWMRGLLSGEQRDVVSDNHMIGILACMVGGVILARTMGSRGSTVVLEACRDFLRQTFDKTSAVAMTRRGNVKRKWRASRTIADRPSPQKRRRHGAG